MLIIDLLSSRCQDLLLPTSLQVWRQINVMYQQMTESARALDKLHQQNEAYVNGTTSTMGGMENKVIRNIIHLD